MRKFTLIAILCAFGVLPALADVIAIPPGATGLKLEFTFEPKPADDILALVYPATDRPAWCKRGNFCISLADSAALVTPYALMLQHPDEKLYHFTFEPGVHAIKISTPIDMDQSVTLDMAGVTLDCLHAHMKKGTGISGDQGCIVAHTPEVTIRGVTFLVGEETADGGRKTVPGTDASFRCIRVKGKFTLEDATLDNCKMGIQGEGGFDWTLRRVTMRNCSFMGSTHAHCVYSKPNDAADATLLIEDGQFETRAGHVVKTSHATTIIRRTNLTEGTAGAGYGIHSTNNGLVDLDDVKVLQRKMARYSSGGPKGNIKMLVVGPNKDRCGGPGQWRFKNVTLIDEQPELYRKANRVLFRCPLPTVAEDLGGNTFNGEPLFVDGELQAR